MDKNQKFVRINDQVFNLNFLEYTKKVKLNDGKFSLNVKISSLVEQIIYSSEEEIDKFLDSICKSSN